MNSINADILKAKHIFVYLPELLADTMAISHENKPNG